MSDEEPLCTGCGNPTMHQGSICYACGHQTVEPQEGCGICGGFCDHPTEHTPKTRELISVQEAWEAAGGNPGIKATKDELLDALRDLDAVCDEVYDNSKQEAVGTVLGGEFHYLSAKHGLADGTQLYAAPVKLHPVVSDWRIERVADSRTIIVSGNRGKRVAIDFGDALWPYFDAIVTRNLK